MRIPVVLTVLAFGLCSCTKVTAYLNADDLTSVASRAPNASACNSLEQDGDEVELVGSREAAPTPQGGTIEDGTYILTGSTLHTKDKPHGAKIIELGKITVVVKGSTSQMVRNGSDGRERRTTVDRAASGTTATLKTTCASPTFNGAESTTTKYTATANSFQFITPGPAGTVVATYTKLPEAQAQRETRPTVGKLDAKSVPSAARATTDSP
jgi:hypothetical protein